MSEEKFSVPTETVDLPSKGKLYPQDSTLAKGIVEIKYMTAKEEDILSNPNYLRQGVAIEKMLKSIIKTPINYEEMLIGDRNAILIASRILAYGKDYTFKYRNPITREMEDVVFDLQKIKYKEVDFTQMSENNEFTFVLPKTKNTITYKILTVGDDKKIDEEVKNLKKAFGSDNIGEGSIKLKYQITSVNGDRTTKTIREFVDKGYLLSIDAIELRKDMTKNTPDIDTNIYFTLSDGQEITTDLPINADFFFPDAGF